MTKAECREQVPHRHSASQAAHPTGVQVRAQSPIAGVPAAAEKEEGPTGKLQDADRMVPQGVFFFLRVTQKGLSLLLLSHSVQLSATPWTVGR